MTEKKTSRKKIGNNNYFILRTQVVQDFGAVGHTDKTYAELTSHYREVFPSFIISDFTIAEIFKESEITTGSTRKKNCMEMSKEKFESLENRVKALETAVQILLSAGR